MNVCAAWNRKIGSSGTKGGPDLSLCLSRAYVQLIVLRCMYYFLQRERRCEFVKVRHEDAPRQVDMQLTITPIQVLIADVLLQEIAVSLARAIEWLRGQVKFSIKGRRIKGVLNSLRNREGTGEFCKSREKETRVARSMPRRYGFTLSELSLRGK
ncbi:hypothetical protein AG1IA_05494 [Rhizoctonia solani AG-1 IA]|uniref:Uncharacterized protein n=1 Tax=Thanatephorus cucumeris (strain AG1-IA) TaxID=983506 RepID=L8WQR6_THACA|nr:hypothetical protein AG1IA_05494 [Rhizoctonia solani AG-1 IA]